jgi:predicted CoA-binding protein
MKETVVVLGASDKLDRYSNKAQKLLIQHGHRVIPVHPEVAHIDGVAVKASLREISEQVDTVTMYVSPERSEKLAAELIALKPRRVIFNPGSESASLQKILQDNGIASEEACTLVLLNTNQFEA